MRKSADVILESENFQISCSFIKHRNIPHNFSYSESFYIFLSGFKKIRVSKDNANAYGIFYLYFKWMLYL